MDIGNVYKKFAKDRLCGSGDILADRKTDGHTDRHTHRSTFPCRGRSKNVVELRKR